MSRARPVIGPRLMVAGVLVVGLLTACGAGQQAAPPGTPGSGSTVSGSSALSSVVSPSSSVATAVPSPLPASSTTPPPPPVSTVPPAPEPPAPVPPASVPPGGLVTPADMAQAAATVATMSLPDQAGAVIMASSADAVGTDLVARLHLGGVILMGSRGSIDGTASGTPDQVATVTAGLQAQLPVGQQGAPLLIGTDQEYGLVTRLVNGFTDFPGNAELSGIPDDAVAAASTEAVTAAAGAELLAVGINVDFAPDADVLPAAGPSGVDERSFGSDPERAGSLVAAAVRGYQRAGVAATVKHFPGIGRLATDTHKALPSLDVSCADWNAAEAVPMRAGVDAGAALVMTGHVLLPAVGATDLSSALSSSVVTDLLRGAGRDGCTGLNFHGVTVSDSFQMAPVVDNFSLAEAAWRGVAAGQDLVLMPADPATAVSGIVDAVTAGSLPAPRLQEAATTVYALRLALARVPRPGMDVVGSDAHAAVAAQARAQG